MDDFIAALDRFNGQLYLYVLVGGLLAVGLWLHAESKW